VTNIKNFNIAPSVASGALFVVWVNNSDLYDETLNGDTNPTEWTTAINNSQTNHLNAILNLYAKGVRNLVMPNAVDVSRVPEFDAYYSSTNFIHQECIAYNVAFSNTLNQAMAACPGLKIYVPDFFTLLNNVLANSADYGLTNALYNYGHGNVSIDAYEALGAACNTNGLGTNYIFWDVTDPSAEFHEVIADVAQQVISPVQISRLAVLNGSNELDVANYPAGLGGFVDGSTNLANWAAVQNIASTNTSQSIFVLAANANVSQLSSFGSPIGIGPGGGNGTNATYGIPQFYRLRFPYAWTWP
jgi:phospholipase/lecithinase/hemolysin